MIFNYFKDFNDFQKNQIIFRLNFNDFQNILTFSILLIVFESTNLFDLNLVETILISQF